MAKYSFKRKRIVFNYDGIVDTPTIGFIAKEGDRAAGFAYGHKILHPDGKTAFFLYSVEMSEEYRNRGFGTKLLSFAKDYARNIGCFEMFVMTDRGNQRACHVYEKLGGKSDYDGEICYVCDLTDGASDETE